MKTILMGLLLPLLLLAQDGLDELVNPREIIPDVVIDLRYSTSSHKFRNLPDGDVDLPKFYTANECLLLMATVQQLKTAQDSLRNIRYFNGREYPAGIGIKIWDGYRPRAVQYLFWEIYPNGTYIANPESGSKHNRGGAVDLTLIDLQNGEELAMPTPYDDFSATASHSHYDLPQNILNNRALLKSIMTEHAGLKAYDAEWWHYEVEGAKDYPLRDFQMK